MRQPNGRTVPITYRSAAISIAVLVSLALPAPAQMGREKDRDRQHEGRDGREGERKHEQRKHEQRGHDQREAGQKEKQDEKRAEVRAQQDARKRLHEQKQEDVRKQRQAQSAKQAEKRLQQSRERISRDREKQLVAHQQRRIAEYRQHLDRQQRAAEQRNAELRQAKRLAQYRYQEQYLQRMRAQQLRIRNDRSHDYAKDPYYRTAPTHRYRRGESFHETNQYGVNLLQQAVRYGYQEGHHAGGADRQDDWNSDYRSSYAYQDANYGYDGYYVDQDDYNHYFREGFRRGYEDGHGRRTEYGSMTDGSQNILGALLSQILGLQPLQ
jgi:hypothetical protein